MRFIIQLAVSKKYGTIRVKGYSRLFYASYSLLLFFAGGLFGLYDGRMEPLFATSKSVESTNQVLWWGDINDPIPC